MQIAAASTSASASAKLAHRFEMWMDRQRAESIRRLAVWPIDMWQSPCPEAAPK
jgi:hypothetical protein